MSVSRQQQFLGQARIDAPHLRSIESGVVNDIDLLAGSIIAGGNAVVLKGFDILTPAGSIGQPASNLQLHTAGGIVLHPLASENGTIFSVPSSRAIEILNAANARVQGGFAANQTNFIGIDLRRSADTTTVDVVQFIDPVTNVEKPKTVPLARTLDYIIVITTQDFSTVPGLLPVAIVTTDTHNNVTDIKDARNFLTRLATGGSVPNIQHGYSFPGGRLERNPTLEPSIVNSDFNTGDKVISSMKDWMDAVMTRLWEIGGGESWYSATADRNVTMARLGTFFTNGEYFEWDGTNLHWRGLQFIFDNSGTLTTPAYYNSVLDQTSDSAGLTNLLDGQCIYVDLDRTQNTGPSAPPFTSGLTPVKAYSKTLGTPVVPGSRFIIAWRVGSEIFTRDVGWPVGSSFDPATGDTTLGNGRLGVVRLTGRPQEDGGWANNLTPEAVLADVTRRAVVTGITRGLAGANSVITAGTIGIAQGTNDTGLAIGHGSAFTTAFTGNVTITTNANPNAVGITVSGNGSGAGGVFGGGGAGDSSGIVATGGLTDGIGVKGIGNNAGYGGSFTGGSTGNGAIGKAFNGTGGTGILGSGGIGVEGTGGLGSFGGKFRGDFNGGGVDAYGAGTGPGGNFTGGPGGNGGYGINTTGGLPNGIGIFGAGSGTAPGGWFWGGTTSGVGVRGEANNNAYTRFATDGGSSLPDWPSDSTRGAGGVLLGGTNGLGADIQNNNNAAFVSASPFNVPSFPALFVYNNNTGNSAVSLYVRGKTASSGSDDAAAALIENAGSGNALFVRNNDGTSPAGVFKNTNGSGISLWASSTNGIGIKATSSGAGDGIVSDNSVSGFGRAIYGHSASGNYVIEAYQEGSGPAIFAHRGVSSGASNPVMILSQPIANGGHLTLTGGNPSIGQTFKNTLTQANVPKAWGVVSLDTLPTFNRGFSVSTLSYDSGVFYGGRKYLVVNLPAGSAMPDTNYVVSAHFITTSRPVILCIAPQSGTQFFIGMYDLITAGFVDIEGFVVGVQRIMLSVFGVQN